MDGAKKLKRDKDQSGKTVRFRVASAHSGRVLAEVFKDAAAVAAWCGSSAAADPADSADHITGTGDAAESEANSHLNGLTGRDVAAATEDDEQPDDLLLYASAKREQMFSRKRVNICSKNGTVRGVRDKVNAGQVLFNGLAMCSSVMPPAGCCTSLDPAGTFGHHGTPSLRVSKDICSVDEWWVIWSPPAGPAGYSRGTRGGRGVGVGVGGTGGGGTGGGGRGRRRGGTGGGGRGTGGEEEEQEEEEEEQEEDVSGGHTVRIPLIQPSTADSGVPRRARCLINGCGR
ncbi:Glutaredoxin domain-containing cysteine-rich protein 1 [Merluccius polli]|uniref:Glutaredoxin domain-containing cysteine-rich protein 1 n=1 Tax=Merluccius polli TaxID=89951 RepID=A0AA47M2Q3_MERPO|nr:Glutaredoxin domain-containing cysteine-rich protein 1 [Merluccius polli]